MSCLLCVIFFSSSTFPTFPCLSFPAVSSPTSISQSLGSFTLYLSLPSSYPVSGRPSFGSARLSCLLHVLSHSLKGKKKFFFPLSFPFSCFATVVLLFFYSTVLMAQQKQLVLPDTFSGRVMMTSTSGFPSLISQRPSINGRKSQSYRCSLCV